MSVETSSLFHPVGSASCPDTSKSIPGNRVWKEKVPESGKTPMKAGREAAKLLPEPWHGALTLWQGRKSWKRMGLLRGLLSNITSSVSHLLGARKTSGRNGRLFPLPGWLWDVHLGLVVGICPPQAFLWKLLALAITLVQRGGAGQSPWSLWGFRARVRGQRVLVWLCWALASEWQWL